MLCLQSQIPRPVVAHWHQRREIVYRIHGRQRQHLCLVYERVEAVSAGSYQALERAACLGAYLSRDQEGALDWQHCDSGKVGSVHGL